MNTKYRCVLVLLALSVCALSFAQETGDNFERTLSPYFEVKSEDPYTDRLPLKSTSARADIVGMIADVTITQEYKNEGQNALEAVYNFPASINAAVYAMEMTVGNRRIVARIEEKAKARQDYEKARDEGKRTSLLEQQRPNVFQMNVANIMPGDRVEVVLKYTELLVPEKGVYSFIYPTVVGPRYSTERKTDGNKNSFIDTPYQHEGEIPYYDFDIEVNLNAGMPIRDIHCASHTINVDYVSMSRAVIELDSSEKKGGDRDFVLSYSLEGESISTGLLLYEHRDENFFLVMVQPPERVTEEDIPPREYIFINDVSGSMRGYPMAVSKQLMRNLVGNLRPYDRFNVLLFSGSSGWMADRSLPATEENIRQAIEFIDAQRGGGGTQILPALQKALSFPREFEEMSRSFVIVTDGYVSVEKEAFELIRRNCDRANTFVFGIGSSVNRYIVDGMARAGMGESFVVLDRSRADTMAERFREYISTPVLTQVKRQFRDFDAYDVEPLTVPDVFAERPVIIFGKYRNRPEGTIALSGYSGRKRWETEMDVSDAAPDEENSALRYLWARKRIQRIDDYGAVGRDQDKAEVTQLGLKYNLLTSNTSFVAIEEVPVSDGDVKLVKQPLPLPRGVSDSAVGFEITQDTKGFLFSAQTTQFHRNVEIHASLKEQERLKLNRAIEETLIPKLDSCFKKMFSINYIEVSVGGNGRVEGIRIDGQNIPPESRACLENAIRSWDFSSFGLQKNWTFRINF